MPPLKPKKTPTVGWRALRHVCPWLTPQQAKAIASGLGIAMKRYGITSPNRAAMFVAQCAHESAGFRTSTEFASGDAYEGRRDLGNVVRGDGRRFKGRGRIMITGRVNYTRVSQSMEQNFVARPERLASPPWSELASAWWWHNAGLNALVDRFDDVDERLRACTRRINGGFNGLDDRRNLHRRALRVKRWLVPS